MNDYRVSRQADRDIIDIYLFSTDHFGEMRAETYVDGVITRFARLAQNPTLGRDYSHVKSGVRRAEYISHSIYFRQVGGDILILRVLHQRMDPARWLYTDAQ